MNDKSIWDRWIIGGLVAAISGILWWLLLDTREQVSTLRNSELSAIRMELSEHRTLLGRATERITSLENRYNDLNEELKDHRRATENKRRD